MKFHSIFICALIMVLVFPSTTYSANAQTLPITSSQVDDTNWIAFVDKENSLFVIHPNGNGKTKISQDLAVLPVIRWSSSGRYLAFISGTTFFSVITGPYSLWIWDSQKNQLVISQEDNITYEWSPTDDVLAYILVESEADPFTIPSKSTYSLNLLYMATGETQTILPAMKGSFGWLPDGKQIAFEPYWEAKPSSNIYFSEGWVEYSGINTIDIQTGEISTLIEPRERPLTGIQISPQGSFVSFEAVFYVDGPGCAFRSMIAPIADTGAWQQLPLSYCEWSPHENKLACNNGGCGMSGDPVSIYDNNYQLITEIPQVSNHLSDAPPGGNLLWAPDEALLAIGIQENTPPFRNATLIVDTESWDILADLQGIAFGWSPDGNYLLLNNQGDSDEGLLGIFDINKQEFQSLGVSSVTNAVWQIRNFPDAPGDVSIRPDAGKQTYVIEWDAINDKNVTYEVRYNSEAINDANWDDARELHGDAQVNDDRVTFQATIEKPGPGFAASKIYIGIRALDENGASSPIAASAWILDWGFRPPRDGYNFANYSEDKLTNWIYDNLEIGGGDAVNDFTKADVVSMFGEDAVCVADDDPECIFTNEANDAYLIWTQWLNKGHCYGMSATSGLVYLGASSLFDGAPSSGGLFAGPDIDQARRSIAYYHVQQFTNPVTDALLADGDLSLQEKISKLTGLIESGEGAVIMLYFPGEERKGGHAVTPYAVEQDATGRYRIWVYDNNYLSVEGQPYMRSIQVNLEEQTWIYLWNEGNQGTWSGQGGTDFFVVPMSLHSAHPTFIGVNDPPRYVVQAPVGSGSVHLSIVDQAENIIGFVEDAFVNQITGAAVQPVFNTPDAWDEPIYWLPAGSSYTVSLSPASSEPARDPLLSWVGDSFSILLNRDTLTQASRLEVGPGGKEMAYSPGEDGPASLSFSQSESEFETRLELHQVPLRASDEIQITYNAAEQDYRVSYTGAAEVAGGLTIILHDRQGEKTIQKEAFPLQPGSTYHIQVNQWSTQGTVQFGVDQDGDGTVERWKTERSQAGLLTQYRWLFFICGGLLLLGGGAAVAAGILLLLRQKKNQGVAQ